MGTLTEEIFSSKLGRAVEQDETVVVDVDRVMSHDTTTPLAIQAFRRLTQGDGSNSGRVFNPRRSHIVFDHIIPAATIAAATLQREIRSVWSRTALKEAPPTGMPIRESQSRRLFPSSTSRLPVRRASDWSRRRMRRARLP